MASLPPGMNFGLQNSQGTLTEKEEEEERLLIETLEKMQGPFEELES